MGMKGFLTIAIAVLMATTAIPYPQNLPQDLPLLNIEFNWSNESLQKDKSPFIRFFNIPSETRYLRITFSRMQMSGIRQRGSIIPYTGKNSLEEGELEDLSLPEGSAKKEGITEYRLTITALDAKQKAIARGSSARSIMPQSRFGTRTLSINEIIVR